MTKPTIEVRSPLTREAVEGFIGEDAAERLDDELDVVINGLPVFTCMGDLHLSGDVDSSDLLVGCPDFERPQGQRFVERAFTVFVRGDLTIDGTLKVSQYHDVYVRGDLRARNVLSHSGNLVVKGTITTDDVVAFETNEEGGLLHGDSCSASLLLHLGSMDWAVEASGRVIDGAVWSDADYVSLLSTLERLGVEAKPGKAYAGVSALVAAGRARELVDAVAASFESRLDAD